MGSELGRSGRERDGNRPGGRPAPAAGAPATVEPRDWAGPPALKKRAGRFHPEFSPTSEVQACPAQVCVETASLYHFLYHKVVPALVK